MYIDHRGKTVPSHTALDASGNLRAGFRRASEVLAEGERLSFDIMTRDAAASATVFLTDAPTASPAPFVSPAQARQAQIAAEAAGQAVARKSMNDQHVAASIATVVTERAMGTGSQVGRALQDARYSGASRSTGDAPTISVADNSHVASALRAARYS